MGYTPSQLADLEEIRTLTHRYGLALDRFDLDATVAVFAPDAVFDMSAFGLPVVEGHHGLREFFTHTVTTMASQMHLFANHVIEFVGADAARGTNYLFQDGRNQEGQRIHSLGLNEDSYVRLADGWRIARRRISPLIPPQLEGF